jgi:hypothetical protein
MSAAPQCCVATPAFLRAIVASIMIDPVQNPCRKEGGVGGESHGKRAAKYGNNV